MRKKISFSKPKKDIPIVFRHGSEAERNMQLIPHTELEKYKLGIANDYSWNTIVCRLNIGMTLAHWYFNREVTLNCRAALDAMVSVRARYKTLNKWGMTGDEMKVVITALLFTDDMQLQVTRKQLSDAVLHVYKVGAV